MHMLHVYRVHWSTMWCTCSRKQHIYIESLILLIDEVQLDFDRLMGSSFNAVAKNKARAFSVHRWIYLCLRGLQSLFDPSKTTRFEFQVIGCEIFQTRVFLWHFEWTAFPKGLSKLSLKEKSQSKVNRIKNGCENISACKWSV